MSIPRLPYQKNNTHTLFYYPVKISGESSHIILSGIYRVFIGNTTHLEFVKEKKFSIQYLIEILILVK